VNTERCKEILRSAAEKSLAGAAIMVMIVLASPAPAAGEDAGKCPGCRETYIEMTWDEANGLLERALSPEGLEEYGRLAEPEKSEMLHTIESAFARRYDYRKTDFNDPRLVELERQAHEEGLGNPETLRRFQELVEERADAGNRYLRGIWLVTGAKISVILGDNERALEASRTYLEEMDELVSNLYGRDGKCAGSPICEARKQLRLAVAMLEQAEGKYGPALKSYERYMELETDYPEDVLARMLAAFAAEGSGADKQAGELRAEAARLFESTADSPKKSRHAQEIETLMKSVEEGQLEEVNSIVNEISSSVHNIGDYERVDYNPLFTFGVWLLEEGTKAGKESGLLKEIALLQVFSAFHGI